MLQPDGEQEIDTLLYWANDNFTISDAVREEAIATQLARVGHTVEFIN